MCYVLLLCLLLHLLPTGYSLTLKAPVEKRALQNLTKLCYTCAPGTHSSMECERSVDGNNTCKVGWCLHGVKCTPCAPGYAQPVPAKPTCDPCGPGYWINITNSSACWDCLAGFYCPLKSNVQMKKCPKGEFCPKSRLGVGIPCLAGFYCPKEEMETPIPCPEGYYCVSGSDNPTKCREDTYCPAGSHMEMACGTFFFSDPGSAMCHPTVGFWCVIAIAAISLFALLAFLGKHAAHTISKRRQEHRSKEITNLIPPSTGPQYHGF